MINDQWCFYYKIIILSFLSKENVVGNKIYKKTDHIFLNIKVTTKYLELFLLVIQ